MNQKDWKNKLLLILKSIGIDNPKSIAIYQEALTHNSYAHEKKIKHHQQRLEFLGDAAIGWIISNYLFKLTPHMNEGEMTGIKAGLVNSKILAQACETIKLNELILLGKGERKKTISPKILEDSFEAFVGAISQDQGIKKTINLINNTLIAFYEQKIVKIEKDPKAQFQEMIQSIHGSATNQIKYENIIDGDKIVVVLKYDGQIFGRAEAQNTKIKEVEKLAALDALAKYSHKE